MLCLGFAALLFSMAGVPPFAGFFAKQGVLEASLASHYGGLAFLAILASVLSASYYLKVVRLMHFSSIPTGAAPCPPLTALHTFTLAALILTLTLYMVLPLTFLDSTRALALSVTLG
jgi:NADH-quinone oxidoreductase subunit A